MINQLKARFINKLFEIDSPSILVVAVKLPNGAIEVITNTTNLKDKADYYLKAYDKEFKLVSNKEVQIIDFIIV